MNLLRLLKKFWMHLSRRRRMQFFILLILIAFISLLEVLTLGTVLPFISILTNPKEIFLMPFAQPFIKFMNLNKPQELVLPVTILFASMAVFAGIARLILLWINTRLAHITGSDISIDIYRKTLYQPYKTHISRNSSEIVSGIVTKTNLIISQIIQPFLVLTSSIIILMIIFLSVILINPQIAFLTFFILGLLYIIIALDVKKRLSKNSKIVAKENTFVIKALQEGLGGIRDVLLNGSQEVYCEIYKNSDLPLKKAQGNNSFIGYSPRYSMEALAMVFLSFLSYMIFIKTGSLSKAMPILGALALGAQRMLPLFQQGYQAWTHIKSSQEDLDDVIKLLEQKLPVDYFQNDFKPIEFSKEILLKHISFQYSLNLPYVLNDINIKIPKGSRIGFIGTTGSGKSTLLDIIMYLLEPTEGELMVDKTIINEENRKSWQQIIANVPQNIFLSDTSIAENIAFGVPIKEIDLFKVKNAAQKAQISEFIETLEHKYQTRVGERGIRLSGGQKQRIGIARALYKDASVIVFDEATRALDNDTEKAVMESINTLSQELTILIIAHRLSTVQNCDKIIELKNGKIINISNGK